MIEIEQKKIVVCDYPSKYKFPPEGYGGIERWLWTIAKYSGDLGLEVLLLGPQWRTELLPTAQSCRKSILNISAKEFMAFFGKQDFLVAGHEYWHDPKLRAKFQAISRKSFTFQLMPDPVYSKKVFDNENHFLFCATDEMMQRFSLQNPSRSYYIAEGYREELMVLPQEEYIIWIGRLDRDKLPHIAVLAANKLHMPIYLLGTSIRDPRYAAEYHRILSMDHVKTFTSEGCVEKQVSGEQKMELIGKAKLAMYTYAPEYIEAAGGVFAEYIRSGIPVAAISWRANDAPNAALGPNSEGGICVGVSEVMSESDIVNALVSAANHCLGIDKHQILRFASKYYSPTKILRRIFATISKH